MSEFLRLSTADNKNLFFQSMDELMEYVRSNPDQKYTGDVVECEHPDNVAVVNDVEQYKEDIANYLKHGKTQKAAEKGWALAIHIVKKKFKESGIAIMSHDVDRHLVFRVAKCHPDPRTASALYSNFILAEGLHHHFYHGDLRYFEVENYCSRITDFFVPEFNNIKIDPNVLELKKKAETGEPLTDQGQEDIEIECGKVPAEV